MRYRPGSIGCTKPKEIATQGPAPGGKGRLRAEAAPGAAEFALRPLCAGVPRADRTAIPNGASTLVEATATTVDCRWTIAAVHPYAEFLPAAR